MRGPIIFIIIVAWIMALAFGFRTFIAKSMGQKTEESEIKAADMMEEQKLKMEQIRQSQKRVMEELKYKARGY